jgi:hypothetical protein
MMGYSLGTDDDCLDVAARAAYIKERAAEYRAINGAYSVPPVETVKRWVKEAMKVAAEQTAGEGDK